MERIVVETEDGGTRTHVGITVCDGPGQHRLLLTKPYNEAGRVVEIPLETIKSITTLAGEDSVV
ncbi:MAG: hypothetical protein WAL25_03095 [Acidimicrobiia bacterium]